MIYVILNLLTKNPYKTCFNLFYYIDIYRDMYTVQYINLPGFLNLQHSMQKKKTNKKKTVIVNKSSSYTDPAEMTVTIYKLY